MLGVHSVATDGNVQLQRVFQFTPEDLSENRDHRLSERQRLRLYRQFMSNIAGFGGIITVLLGIGVIAGWLGVWMVTIWAVLLSGPLAYLLWRQERSTRLALSSGVVDTVRGHGTVGRRSRSTGQAYVRSSMPYLEVSLTQFELREHQARAIVDGGDYTVYYVQGLGVVVAVERHDYAFPMF